MSYKRLHKGVAYFFGTAPGLASRSGLAPGLFCRLQGQEKHDNWVSNATLVVQNNCRSPAFPASLEASFSATPVSRAAAAHSRCARQSCRASACLCTAARACTAAQCPRGLYCETTLRDALSIRCADSHHYQHSRED